MQRWQAVARRAALAAIPLGEADRLPVWAFQTKTAAQAPAIYLSTGVHGDEPAGPWALLAWAEAHISELKTLPFLLVPCFNPVGFINNTRLDAQRLDMNRRFHLPRARHMKAWHSWLAGLQVRLGVCLHEDYDATGCYVYELAGKQKRLANHALTHVQQVLPRDKRRSIDGQPAQRGIICRETAPTGIHGPEAIVLTQIGCPSTLTFETPSEWDIDVRIAAHIHFLEAVCHS
jgi:murein peptide amidase A